MVRFAFSVFLLLALAGCDQGVSRAFLPQYAPGNQANRNQPKTVVLFLDGTGNDLNTVTNVGRLHHLVTLQNRSDLSVFYTSGVGTDSTYVVGLTTGLGFRNDVLNAYAYLSHEYSGPQDRIHLYGFSRGAFAARALAGLVHTVGLVDLSSLEQQPGNFNFELERKRWGLLQQLFTAYKFPGRTTTDSDCPDAKNDPLREICRRRIATAKVLAKAGIETRYTYDQIKFDVVGLWDTIETLGVPNGRDSPDFYNHRYSDQICNMRRVFHAVSLDDNRARVYTPVLMTRKRLIRDCDEATYDHFNRVEEVWFAGAHGDVGGSYEAGALGGVSLNWMLRKTRGLGHGGRSIYPEGSAVFEDPLDIAHDAKNLKIYMRPLGGDLRDLNRYQKSSCLETEIFKDSFKEVIPCGNAVGPFKIHSSAIKRAQQGKEWLDALKRRDPDGHLVKTLSYKDSNMIDCIAAIPTGGGHAPNCPVLIEATD